MVGSTQASSAGTTRRLSISSACDPAMSIGRPSSASRQNKAETVDIRLGGDVAAREAQLFRRHVVQLASERAAEDCRFPGAPGAGDAEIDNLGAANVAVRHD